MPSSKFLCVSNFFASIVWKLIKQSMLGSFGNLLHTVHKSDFLDICTGATASQIAETVAVLVWCARFMWVWSRWLDNEKKAQLRNKYKKVCIICAPEPFTTANYCISWNKNLRQRSNQPLLQTNFSCQKRTLTQLLSLDCLGREYRIQLKSSIGFVNAKQNDFQNRNYFQFRVKDVRDD